MNLNRFDLNLLLVFEAVFRERSVTKAGDRLGLSQPALSHALNRLRWLMKDELFIRGPGGMMPTARAEVLAMPVRRALSELQMALDPEQFVAAKAERRFVIAINNYAAIVLAAPIAAKIAAIAPGIRLCLKPSGTLDVPDLLDRGDLDLAIAAREAPQDRFASQVLSDDRYVIAMRRGHPALVGKLTLRKFAAMPELCITSSGDDLRFVDAAFGEAGHKRMITLEAPYHSAGTILVQSDLVAVLVNQVAIEFRRRFPIEIRELPFASQTTRSIMLWHRRFDSQPSHRWLRETITSLT
jgi:DNA-binding transcriptional LysR family regulator